ncbi:hypothetical protein, conserved [Trypanosoma brucei gambiense DAL972]|uniref:Uncharacterized protein n=1 Tax=Trypanosoma brucei gambiense (strain MHOM/CI/86/DAL972) TaxID=679716 RepID=C9ZU26_TRYB9|nr:hypothetical protein, conserved [Trypanosoma brucei gambiense DAL972]CBH12912.1 hypothetical protein, conserved [Trypanosoma brucei gambiense DAL972]|eukprot:XP_011775191.1 hypothetical protein, conserved [Trypanosoma brucei gambiense DAL972]
MEFEAGPPSRRPESVTTSELTHTPSSTGTTAGTGASFDYGWQTQRESTSRAPSVAHNMTSTVSTDDNNRCQRVKRALYVDEGMPIHEPHYYKDWASPAEVLQLRTICTDLATKHKNETAALRRELEEVRNSRNALLLEAEETRRLHQVCVRAEGEHEKARREYSRWEGERELLRLQLQRLSLDNQRLRQIAGQRGNSRGPPHQQMQSQIHGRHHHQQFVGQAPSSGSSELRAFTSGTTPMTGSTIPTPSFTSSSLPQNMAERGAPHQEGAQQPQRRQTQSMESVNGIASSGSAAADELTSNTNGFNSNVNNYLGSGIHSKWGSEQSTACSSQLCLREQLRLMEELNRTTMAYTELEARLNFAQTLWDLSAAREAQHSLMLSAEADRLRLQLNHWRSLAEDTAGRLEATDAQLRDCRDELDETQRKLQAAAATTAAAVAAERKESQDCVALLKLNHAAELSQAQMQLQRALDDNAHGRETLQRTLETLQKQTEAQRAQLVSDVAVAEQRAAEAVRAKCESDAALAETVAQHASECQRLERELLIERSAGRRCVEENVKQAGELESLRGSCMTLEMRVRETEAELGLVAGRLNDALEKLSLSAKMEEELESVRLRAEGAEQELKEQRKHYEEKQQVHLASLAKLQRERDADVLRLERDVEKLRRRCKATKIRLAAAVKDATGWSVEHNQPQGSAASQGEGSDEGSCAAACEDVRPDAVSLLKQSAALAGTLARTIQRSTYAP